MNSDTVYIIGGGESLRGFNFFLLDNKDTIVVNKSLFSLNNPTYYISVDQSSLKKIFLGKDRFTQINIPKFFVANLGLDYMKEIDGRIVDIRTNLYYQLEDYDIIIKSYDREGIGFSWNAFRNGINSGHCALQLAVLLGYKVIYLLGIDMCVINDTHFHGGYGESKKSFISKLEEYYRCFKIGLDDIKEHGGIEVFSCSKSSRLNGVIPYRDIYENL